MMLHREGLKNESRRMAVAVLLLSTLGVSTAFGMLLLLPLYVQELGGDESGFGAILSAAALPAVLCIGLLIRRPERFKSHTVVAAAMAAYAAGAAGIGLVVETWEALIGVGVLLGTAWAVVYTASPMVMSGMVTDAGRAKYFGYLTGTQQIGIGAGPVIARFLVETPLGFRGTFLTAGAICLTAAGLMLANGFVPSETQRFDGKASHRASASTSAAEVGFRDAASRIARSEAVFPLVMIVLFAFLFTAMSQFQTTFASSRDLDYSIFFVSYTLAVVFSRFVLAQAVSRFDARQVIAASVTAMTLAVAAFLVLGRSALLYGAASALLGIGYGLALPTVQAQAVNVADVDVRPRILPLAGLVFQAAILGFPVVAGWMIAGIGYDALFAMLLAFAFAQAVIGWWRYVTATRTTSTTPAPGT